MKKFFKIVFSILGVIFLGIVAYYSYFFIKIKNGDLVKWDNKWYAKEELKKLYPPQYHNTPEKNTPEQVYAEFREALLKKDITRALALIAPANRDKYFSRFKDEALLKKYQTIPDSSQIKKAFQGDLENFASYYYIVTDSHEINNTYDIEFLKNANGYWEISAI
jgi:hypothetical protein